MNNEIKKVQLEDGKWYVFMSSLADGDEKLRQALKYRVYRLEKKLGEKFPRIKYPQRALLVPEEYVEQLKEAIN